MVLLQYITIALKRIRFIQGLVSCGVAILVLLALVQLSFFHLYAQSPGLVINELGILGTASSASDEWIELYNASHRKINLNGYVLTINQKEIPLYGDIDAYDYYLLERTDDTSIVGIKADIIYTGSLSNDGAVLELKDSNNVLIDRVEEWYPLQNKNSSFIERRASIQRINPFISGAEARNWSWSTEKSSLGLSETGEHIIGSPSAQNTATITAFGYGYEKIQPGEMSVFPPNHLKAVQQDHQVLLSWENTGASPYHVLQYSGESIFLGQETQYLLTPTASETTVTLQAQDYFFRRSKPITITFEFEEPQNILHQEILFNEVQSFPVFGASEWVEIYNSTHQWKSLKSCAVFDARTQIFSFTDTAAIAPKAVKKIDLTSNKLNNSGDTLKLSCSYHTKEEFVDFLFYGNHSPQVWYPSSEGYSLSQGYLPSPDGAHTLARSNNGGEQWFLADLQRESSPGKSNPDLKPLPAVSHLEITQLGKSVLLSWQNPNKSGVSGVIIERKLWGKTKYEFLVQLEPTENSWKDVGLQEAVYEYRVSAVYDSKRISTNSPEKTVSVSGLKISEVLPYPKSQKKAFIEIHNTSSALKTLSGYELIIANTSDSLTKPSAVLPLNMSVQAGGYALITSEMFPDKLRLSRTRAVVFLLDNEGVLVSRFSYENAQRGVSFAYTDYGITSFLHPTPLEANKEKNNPPVAVITVQGAGKTNACKSLSFNPTGANSLDEDGDELTYLWTYSVYNKNTLHTETKENPTSFRFEEGMGKRFLVELIVTDSFGVVDKEQLELNLGVCKNKKTTPVSDSHNSEKETHQDLENIMFIGYQQVVINEVFPNPRGKDKGREFIELYNRSESPVDLTGWKLKVKSQKLLPQTILEPGEVLLVHHVSLHNTQAEVWLLDSLDNEVDRLEYQSPEEGKSFSRNPKGVFLWTLATPGEKNDFPFEVEDLYVQLSAQVVINRVLPNPKGKDSLGEWVEIQNRSQVPVDIKGWSLANRKESNKRFTFTEPQVLQVGQVLKINVMELGFTWRNSGDTVRLLNAEQELLDTLTWKEPARDNQVISRDIIVDARALQPDDARVERVIDGDTLEVRFIKDGGKLENFTEKVRLIGVDTPESVHPYKPLQAFAQQASDYTKQHLLGERVVLRYDLSKRGKYGRLLAYVYKGDTFFNAQLIREGYAFAYTRYPFAHREMFRKLELEAQNNSLGIWAHEEPSTLYAFQEESWQEDDELQVFEEILKEKEESILEKIQENQQEKKLEREDAEVLSLLTPPVPVNREVPLRFNEVLVNPKGKDTQPKGHTFEFIELVYNGLTAFDVKGWTIKTNKNKLLYEFSNKTVLPGQVILISSLKSSLPNTSPHLFLYDDENSLVDSLYYEHRFKDDQVLILHPVFHTWELGLLASPGKHNPFFSSCDPAQDLDGDTLCSQIEEQWGFNPLDRSSQKTTWPDDFMLYVRHYGIQPANYLSSYQNFLQSQSSVFTKQTTRTFRIWGKSKPYTVVQLEFGGGVSDISVPVLSDGNWEYKVSVMVPKGQYNMRVFARDWLGRKVLLKSLMLNISKTLNKTLITKKRSKKSRVKNLKPLYRVIEPLKEIKKSVVKQQFENTLILEDGSQIFLNAQASFISKLLVDSNILIKYYSDKSNQLLIHSVEVEKYTSSQIKAGGWKTVIVFILVVCGVVALFLQSLQLFREDQFHQS